MQKIYPSPQAVLEGVLFDGMTIMSGGFGLSGNPESLIAALKQSGVKGLTVISNSFGADGFGLWTLLKNRRIRKMISSYIGDKLILISPPGFLKSDTTQGKAQAERTNAAANPTTDVVRGVPGKLNRNPAKITGDMIAIRQETFKPTGAVDTMAQVMILQTPEVR